MLSKVMDSICKRLKEKFNCEVYAESVRQGLKEPCFFVQLAEHKKIPQSSNRYLVESTFCITYYPESMTEPMVECCRVIDDLQFAILYLEIDEFIVRGINMSSEMRDNVLHFMVDYVTELDAAEEHEKMETLKQGVSMK